MFKASTINASNVGPYAGQIREADAQRTWAGMMALTALLGGGAAGAYMLNKQRTHAENTPGRTTPTLEDKVKGFLSKKKSKQSVLTADSHVVPPIVGETKEAGIDDLFSRVSDGFNRLVGEVKGDNSFTPPTSTIFALTAGVPLAYLGGKALKSNIDEMYRNETSSERAERYKKEYLKLLESNDLESTPENIPFKKAAAFIDAIEDNYLDKSAGISDIYKALLLAPFIIGAGTGAYTSIRGLRKYDEDEMKSQAAQEAFNRYMSTKPPEIEVLPVTEENSPEKYDSLDTPETNIVPLKINKNTKLANAICTSNPEADFGLVKFALDLEDTCSSANIRTKDFAIAWDLLEPTEKVALFLGKELPTEKRAAGEFYANPESMQAFSQAQPAGIAGWLGWTPQAAMAEALKNNAVFRGVSGLNQGASTADIMKYVNNIEGSKDVTGALQRSILNHVINQTMTPEQKSVVYDQLKSQGFNDDMYGNKPGLLGDVKDVLTSNINGTSMPTWSPLLAAALAGGGALGGHPLLGLGGAGLALALPYVWSQYIQPYLAQNNMLGQGDNTNPAQAQAAADQQIKDRFAARQQETTVQNKNVVPPGASQATAQGMQAARGAADVYNHAQRNPNPTGGMINKYQPTLPAQQGLKPPTMAPVGYPTKQLPPGVAANHFLPSQLQVPAMPARPNLTAAGNAGMLGNPSIPAGPLKPFNVGGAVPPVQKFDFNAVKDKLLNAPAVTGGLLPSLMKTSAIAADMAPSGWRSPLEQIAQKDALQFGPAAKKPIPGIKDNFLGTTADVTKSAAFTPKQAAAFAIKAGMTVEQTHDENGKPKLIIKKDKDNK